MMKINYKINKIILVITLVFMLTMFTPGIQFQFNIVKSGDWRNITPNDILTPLASAGSDYVDTTQTLTYGTVTDVGDGMWGVESGYSELEEAAYVGSSSYTTLQSHSLSTFPPTGWSNTNWVKISSGGQSGAYGKFSRDDWKDPTTATLDSNSIDTSSYDGVRISFYWKAFPDRPTLYLKTYDGSWDTQWTSSGNPSSWTQVIVNVDESYASWKVRWYAVSDTYIYGGVGIDTLLIEGRTDTTYYRFDAVFKFDSIDYGCTEEFLFINITSGSTSESYSVYVESDDVTPDYLLTSSQAGNVSGYWNISSYLTGPTFYVRIVDVSQSGDTDQDNWLFSGMYAYINTPPVNNPNTPHVWRVWGNGETTTVYSLYPRDMSEIGTYYLFTANVTDANGYSDIDRVQLGFYDTSNVWLVQFDEDTNTFTEVSTSVEIELDTPGCSYIKSGNDIDITFKIWINWEHPHGIDTFKLRQIVWDTTAKTDDDIYPDTHTVYTEITVTADNSNEDAKWFGAGFDTLWGGINWGYVNVKWSGTLATDECNGNLAYLVMTWVFIDNQDSNSPLIYPSKNNWVSSYSEGLKLYVGACIVTDDVGSYDYEVKFMGASQDPSSTSPLDVTWDIPIIADIIKVTSIWVADTTLDIDAYASLRFYLESEYNGQKFDQAYPFHNPCVYDAFHSEYIPNGDLYSGPLYSGYYQNTAITYDHAHTLVIDAFLDADNNNSYVGWYDASGYHWIHCNLRASFNMNGKSATITWA